MDLFDPSEQPLPPSLWWSGGLRFSCLGCGRCCRGDPGGIFLTVQEESRAAGFLQMHVEEFRRNCETSRWRFPSLRERFNGECLFLGGQNRCGIYPVRPLACRSWPFWPSLLESPENWAKAARHCPGMDQGRFWSGKRIAAILAVHQRHSDKLQRDWL